MTNKIRSSENSYYSKYYLSTFQSGWTILIKLKNNCI